MNEKQAQLKLEAAAYLAVNAAPYWRSSLHVLGGTTIFTDKVPVMGVDIGWRLYANPERVIAMPTTEVAYVLIHEVSHLLKDHAPRGAEANAEHEVWNISGDLEINCAKWTADDGYSRVDLPLPKEGLHPTQYGWPEGLTAEEYLAKLRKLPPSDKQGGQGKSAQKGKQGQNQATGSGKGKPQPGGSCSDGIQRPWEEPLDSEKHPALGEVEQAAKRMEAAKEMEKHMAEGRGSLPSGWERWAKSVLKPVAPWKSLLRSCAANGVARCGLGRQTYTRSRRRGAMIMPRHKMPQPVICVVTDTSGSMGEGEGPPLQRALSEVIGVVKLVGQVNVVWCDAEGHLQRNVRRLSDLKPVGGGGTNQTVGIEHAEKLKGADKPDLTICVTDTYTPWPSSPTKTPLIVVAVGDTTKGVPSWAKTIMVPV